jgi:GntR family histidine utilization transcriptional repressor
MVSWVRFIVYTTGMPARPRYQQVKDLVRERIAAGKLAEGDPLPSETALAESLGFSRLTVQRALRELTAEGALLRFRRRGNFVAPLAPQSSAITVETIERQVALRGPRHGARLIEAGTLKADAPLAERLELRPGTRVFRSRLVLLEDDVPIQFEERHVNPRVVPDYLSIDFATTTPAQYLQEHDPLREVEHSIVAESADAAIAALLEVPLGSACLTILRRTWSNGRVATCARLVHPGTRFRLFNRFRPG